MTGERIRELEKGKDQNSEGISGDGTYTTACLMQAHMPLQECEDALRIVNTLPRNLLPLERAALQLRRSVAGELAQAGVLGVASTWGGDWRKPPLPPQ